MVSPLDVVAGSVTPPASQSQSPFFQMFPPEIRRAIYSYCAYDYFAVDDPEPAILKACKKTALEATAPMQKYARVTLLFQYDLCAEDLAEASSRRVEGSVSEGEAFANADEVSDSADEVSDSSDEESTDYGDEDKVGESGTRFLGVHSFASAHMAKVEHVFINLVTVMDKFLDDEDLYLTLTWDLAWGDPFLHSKFAPSMPMLDAFALSHG